MLLCCFLNSWYHSRSTVKYVFPFKMFPDWSLTFPLVSHLSVPDLPALRIFAWPSAVLMPVHGGLFVQICAQHGLQDGGVFVAVNCPFVVSLWLLNGSLCCWLIKLLQTVISLTHKHTHTQTLARRATAGGVGNDVKATLGHKLTNRLTYSVIVDELISYPNWSHLPATPKAIIAPESKHPPISGWGCSGGLKEQRLTIRVAEIYILWPTAEGLIRFSSETETHLSCFADLRNVAVTLLELT